MRNWTLWCNTNRVGMESIMIIIVWAFRPWTWIFSVRLSDPARVRGRFHYFWFLIDLVALSLVRRAWQSAGSPAQHKGENYKLCTVHCAHLSSYLDGVHYLFTQWDTRIRLHSAQRQRKSNGNTANMIFALKRIRIFDSYRFVWVVRTAHIGL